MQKINCIKCKHFFVTYEPRRPYGCRAYGFKGSKMPSVIVYQSSGMECESFELKVIKK
ncbi:MAG TPA: uracil-DNA glycosylase [Campylobacterales bacterium]|nr:uracil-DNA glycosylase [Campylobacterales bacterium]